MPIFAIQNRLLPSYHFKHWSPFKLMPPFTKPGQFWEYLKIWFLSSSNYFFRIIFLNRPENGSLRVQKKAGHFSTRYLAICSGAETEPEPKGRSRSRSIFGRLRIPAPEFWWGRSLPSSAPGISAPSLAVKIWGTTPRNCREPPKHSAAYNIKL